jgi:hypothetical protein
MKKILLFSLLIFGSVVLIGQEYNKNKFRQLKQELPTPNVYRTASGAPGHGYYQQKADYEMDIILDDNNQKLFGEGTVKYFNNSPDKLEYLWVQLDQNVRAKTSDSKKIATRKVSNGAGSYMMNELLNDFDGGYNIDYIQKEDGTEQSYTINKTMLRINLETPLAPGASFTFKMKWNYNINDRDKVGGRSGMEYFEDEDNYLYTIAQFYPRMCVYNDVEGWQNKQFLGRGEFALVFGDYKVNITTPSDHVVGATGDLTNVKDLLTSAQYERWEKSKTSYDDLVIIVTQKEAEKAEKKKATTTKTWRFDAKNVRDFAFASSRKFIWDAMAVKQEGAPDVMAMSYYPKEGNPLWEQYSTKAVAQTLRTYSKFTIPYPYPKAISVHSKSIGMEYPMICFNFGRPEKDGTYSDRTKYGMLGVIIHEVGHNYFPMIINSDERQWTWMDEGLNTFLQYLTEQEFERDFPSRRGPAYKITNYMKGDKSKISPIMTNSESIFQFGNNAYGKPATALNILRETIMGRELFDYAFKIYAERWAFKHPTPADFFRTMEDASGVDLDWFWRGWFYTTDYVDISMDEVKWLQIDTKNPDIEKAILKKSKMDEDNSFIGNQRNKTEIESTYNERDTRLNDFYTSYDEFKVTTADKEQYKKFMEGYTIEQKATMDAKYNFYEITFTNVGGLVMPIILEWEYKDGTKEKEYIPAEIWKMTSEGGIDQSVTKVFIKKKEVTNIVLDPNLETADCDLSNNYWPNRILPTRFQMYQDKKVTPSSNPMQKAKK